MEKKVKIELIVAIVIVAILAAVGLWIYFFYMPNSTKTTTTPTTKTVEKTIIEDTSDPNIKKVTPAKQDTLDVKTADGTTVTVPVYTPPKK